MKELTIKLRGTASLSPSVLIDGKAAKIKKNDFGGYIINHETDKPTVNVKVIKYLEINGRLWWFFSWIFFIISIFGILEPRYDKRCIIIDADFDVVMDGDKQLELSLTRPSEEHKALNIKTEAEVHVNKNYYYIDQVAKKRMKIMRIVKWLTFVAVIVVVIAAIVLSL